MFIGLLVTARWAAKQTRKSTLLKLQKGQLHAAPSYKSTCVPFRCQANHLFTAGSGKSTLLAHSDHSLAGNRARTIYHC